MAKNLFRDPHLAKQFSRKIHALAPKDAQVKICHVCGTHEWTITHHGLRSLIPLNVEVIAGPGCPVCIVPASEVDEAVELALNNVTVTCFGDVLRVPGSKSSLLDAKAKGADVRVVYSVSNAVQMAKREEKRQFVFFAVGFETTAPSTAIEVSRNPPRNLQFLTSHRVIPPAMMLLAQMKDLKINAFIAPGHVSTIIGLQPYQVFPEKYGLPVVVAGFEPLDVLSAIYMVMKQLHERTPRLENEYTRAVRPEGNIRAKKLMEQVFKIEDGKWRGLGVIPQSKLSLKEEYAESDARLKYNLKVHEGIDSQPGCRCHLVIVGKIKPTQCPLFMKTCTPQTPVGACMVGMEGTCRVWATTSSFAAQSGP